MRRNQISNAKKQRNKATQESNARKQSEKVTREKQTPKQNATPETKEREKREG
jgi:hypothetical protein